MQKKKLYRYYHRLLALDIGEIHEITLSEIAVMLFTSERYARTLMKHFQTNNWVNWTPKVGRNQRSLLQILMTAHDAQIQIASELIAQGKYEAARDIIDNDDKRFAQLLESTSGVVRREGLLHVQLTYRRKLRPLYPQAQQRNSERFLLRQVYACLTECDTSGQLKPQLAHHWEYLNTALKWRFYLRPNLRFHDGSVINAYRLVALFNALKKLPEYEKEMRHIQSISATSELVIEFTLTCEDKTLAALFSDIRYSIQPEQQVNLASNKSLRLIGSGAFKLDTHTDEKLELAAFDDFYACRALTDSVTIWQLRTEDDAVPCDLVVKPNCLVNLGRIKQEQKTKLTSDLKESLTSSDSSLASETSASVAEDIRGQERVEDGCLLMVLNQQGNALTHEQAKRLTSIITRNGLSERLNNHVTDSAPEDFWAIPAGHLLHQWPKLRLLEPEASPLPAVTIAIFDHDALQICAAQIKHILEAEGIDCRVDIFDFELFNQKLVQGELQQTIVLSSINLDDNRPMSLFRWLYSSSLLHHCLSERNTRWLDHELSFIRAQLPPTAQLHALEPIVSSMIHEHWIQPLIHHKQTLRFQDVLKGVEMSTWGWPLLKDVWQAN